MNYYNIYACDLLINPQILKLATPREIFLLVIKEANDGARNNIKILNPLDHITCLADYTLYFLLHMSECIIPDVSQGSERNSLNNKFQRMCCGFSEYVIPLFVSCLPHVIVTGRVHTVLSALDSTSWWLLYVPRGSQKRVLFT